MHQYRKYARAVLSLALGRVVPCQARVMRLKQKDENMMSAQILEKMDDFFAARG